MNPGKVLIEKSKLFPDKTAIIYKDKYYTYEQINNISNSIANSLRESGIKKGDSVAVILPNCIAFALIYFGVTKLGAIFTPIDIRLGETETLSILNDCKTKLCFVYPKYNHTKVIKDFVSTIDISSENFISMCKNLSDNIITEVEDNETALYLHTSGTTSKPKIVELTYSNLDCFPITLKGFLNGEKEIMGMVLPMSHISGPIVLNELVVEGCKMVIIDQINPITIFEEIHKHRITYFHAVPPIFNLMLKTNSTNYDLSSLRLIAMMGTSVPLSIMRQFKEKFPHTFVIQGYGLTETSPLITVTPLENSENKMHSIGKPVPDAEIKVVDEKGNFLGPNEIGELTVKGPMVMKGYLGNSEVNKEKIKNGFYYTGDLVKYDEENYYYYMGRRDDLIVLSNGLKVYLAEIENVLLTNVKVLEAAVVGVYSEKEMGNILAAFIVPVKGINISESEIRSFCGEHLATFKVPKQITFVDSIPKTSTGKVIKSELINY